MDAQEFQRHADKALQALNRALLEAGDEYGFETDFHAGALTVEFEKPPAKFVVSPNSPVRQIWVSARTKSFKLDWDEVEGAFIHPATGLTLVDLMASVIGEQLGEEVTL